MERRHAAKETRKSPKGEGELKQLSAGAKHFRRAFGETPKPLEPRQARVILQRLRVLLGEALENARRCQVELSVTQLILVCDELLREVREPGYRPEFGSSVEGFLLSGLFDELVQQPSNVFEVATAEDGRQFYVPLSAENWAACVETLRLSLIPSQ